MVDVNAVRNFFQQNRAGVDQRHIDALVDPLVRQAERLRNTIDVLGHTPLALQEVERFLLEVEGMRDRAAPYALNTPTDAAFFLFVDELAGEVQRLADAFTPKDEEPQQSTEEGDVPATPSVGSTSGPSHSQPRTMRNRIAEHVNEPGIAGSYGRGFLHLAIIAAFVYSVRYWNSEPVIFGAATLLLIVGTLVYGMKNSVSMLGKVTILLLLLIHGFAISVNFGISFQLMAVYVVLMSLQVIILLLGSSNVIPGEFIKETFLAFVLAPLVSYTLPPLAQWAMQQGYIGEPVYAAVVSIVTFVPIGVVFLFMMLHGHSQCATDIMRAYRLLIVIAVILASIGSVIIYAINHTPQGGLNPITGVGDAITKLYEYAKENLLNAKNRVVGLADRATDPSKYYTGQVEQNKKKPLGVTISNLRPQDKVVTSDDDVVVFGTVSAKSFVQDKIIVNPACIIDRNPPVASLAKPERLDLIYGVSQSFECRFKPLSKGTYTVTGIVNFPFETWAYIPFTFVDEERARNFARQGKDIKEVLDITELPVATYTSGPVVIGMGGSTQPILVKPDGNPIVPEGTTIGVTIENSWGNGKLQQVDSWQIKVPAPFKLEGCDRAIEGTPEQDPNDPLYTTYRFNNTNIDVLSYTSVTCRLQIDESLHDAALSLVSEGDKTQRSFVAVAKYRYSIEEKTSVVVRE